jgi:hypothetical protein
MSNEIYLTFFDFSAGVKRFFIPALIQPYELRRIDQRGIGTRSLTAPLKTM